MTKLPFSDSLLSYPVALENEFVLVSVSPIANLGHINLVFLDQIELNALQPRYC